MVKKAPSRFTMTCDRMKGRRCNGSRWCASPSGRCNWKMSRRSRSIRHPRRVRRTWPCAAPVIFHELPPVHVPWWGYPPEENHILRMHHIKLLHERSTDQSINQTMTYISANFLGDAADTSPVQRYRPFPHQLETLLRHLNQVLRGLLHGIAGGIQPLRAGRIGVPLDVAGHQQLGRATADLPGAGNQFLLRRVALDQRVGRLAEIVTGSGDGARVGDEPVRPLAILGTVQWPRAHTSVTDELCKIHKAILKVSPFHAQIVPKYDIGNQSINQSIKWSIEQSIE